MGGIRTHEEKQHDAMMRTKVPVSSYDDPIGMSAPEPIHGNYHPPTYQQSSSGAGDTYSHEYQQHDQASDRHSIQVYYSITDKTYNILAMCILARWVLAIVIIGLSIVVMHYESYNSTMVIAAIYSIGAASTHLSFPGYPKLASVSPDTTELPVWFKLMSVFTMVVWIPSFSMLLQGFSQGEFNYSPWMDSRTGLSQAVLATAVLSIFAFLLSTVICFFAFKPKSQQWTSKTIA